MKKRKADTNAGQEKPTLQSTAGHVPTRSEFEGLAPDVRIALIQELIPLALMAAREEMEREVEELALLFVSDCRTIVYEFPTPPLAAVLTVAQPTAGDYARRVEGPRDRHMPTCAPTPLPC